MRADDELNVEGGFAEVWLSGMRGVCDVREGCDSVID